MQKGYTLIEILVAVTIFTIVIAAPTGFFVGSLKAQIKSLAAQKLLDNTSYALEYISRALRMAKKELSTNPANACLLQDETILYGYNYQITQSETGLKFINYKGECQEFFLGEGRLKESKAGKENYLTSEDLEITSLKFKLSGESQFDEPPLQPRVTLFLEIKGGKGQMEELRPLIKIQTTISQRNLDVPY